jgi:hypothetical protein
MPITIDGSGTITGASTLATTVASPTLTTPNINSAQFATVSGTAPIYPCRAWVNFNGTGTVAIRASGNVTSITDNGAGDYTVNFTTAMPDANYSVSVTGSGNSTGAGNNRIIGSQDGGGTSTVSAVRIAINTTTVAYDSLYTNVSVFR